MEDEQKFQLETALTRIDHAMHILSSVKDTVESVLHSEKIHASPNDSDLLRDQLKGETTEHADPPRLEDEGQSGG